MTGNITLIALDRAQPPGGHRAEPVRDRERLAALAQLLVAGLRHAGWRASRTRRRPSCGTHSPAPTVRSSRSSRSDEDEDGHPVAAAMVLGTPRGRPAPGRPYLFQLFTASSHRRRGLAEQLVRQVMASLHENGYDEARAFPRTTPRRLALYLTLHFTAGPRSRTRSSRPPGRAAPARALPARRGPCRSTR
ncbi:GNAT family N-acetyltransferase [Kocuria rhizophila]|nr:GNAT family N-acetyltransferase [Kocuria rhizophila]